ncbi:hypothetical protein [Kribbella sp. VKM Ac-2568]|uniref:hypothetical protein n=1 Tax=Kribbella sp. VKM Ac-2568 TaxID=2512219 RepID=UPI00104B21A7|nr:hypothetical protein [Kribbella sp. VKM Ac-2568]TCM38200.1 SpoU rRNA methylase family protein [Kribbella sp. VKM Ac-2568]
MARGTLLRTCDAVGACLAVPKLPWVPEALARGNTLKRRTCVPAEALDQLDVVVEIPMIGTGASLNVAVAGSPVLYRLAGLL